MQAGLIGAGYIAPFHLRILQRIRNVQILGIVDTRPGVAASMAAQLGIPHHFDDSRRFYEQLRPDIVHVLTPPQTHRTITVDALRRGIHVLTEKPMAFTVEDCEAMEAAAEASGVTLGVNHQILFDARVRTARKLVQGGGIGDVMHVETLYAFDIRRLKQFSVHKDRQTHWVFRLPGQLLEDLVPHPLYLTLAFVRSELRLTHRQVTTTGRIGPGLPDELRLSLTNESTTASLTMSLSIRPDEFTVTVYGTRGTLRLDVQNMLALRARLGRGPRSIARGKMVVASCVRAIGQVAWNAGALALGCWGVPGDVGPLIRAHYASLAAGGPPAVAPTDGKRTVDIIRQVWPLDRRTPRGAGSPTPTDG